MQTQALIMMLVALLLIWGGLLWSIVHLYLADNKQQD